MLDTEITINKFLLQYAHRLLNDIDDARFVDQPLPEVNHPAWILGHVALSADRGIVLLGGEKTLPVEWTPLFGPGSKPLTHRSDYPSKEELLKRVDVAYENFRSAAHQATNHQLKQPSTNPYTKDALPTVRESLAFLLTGHLAVHLGQLSTWRRMIGLPSLF